MDDQPIIIKRPKKAGHAHHGGAWKIAYADFVTAMMAFFLLMWLISMTTPEQKSGLADFFAPASISRSNSGAGGVMGGTAFDTEGARMPGTQPKVVMTVSTPAAPKSPGSENERTARKDAGESEAQSKSEGSASLMDDDVVDAAISSREEESFRTAAESLRQAMADMPELAELSRNILIDETPEGLRIQLTDQDGRSMFPSGLADPYDRTRLLMQQVARIVQRLPNRLTIAGHTDANPVASDNRYSNWELTADRANAIRRIMQEEGVSDDRIYQVSGKADSDPLFPEDPYLPANRRVTIVLLREAPVLPPTFSP